MIQPFSRLASARIASMSFTTSDRRPDTRILVFRADVSSPIDVDVGVIDLLEGLLTVQQDDHAVGVVGKSFCQLPAGRNMNGFSDPIERNPVPRRQRLHAADAGDHFIFKRKAALGFYLLDNPQSAVVERRVSPDEECATFFFPEFFLSSLS